MARDISIALASSIIGVVATLIGTIYSDRLRQWPDWLSQRRLASKRETLQSRIDRLTAELELIRRYQTDPPVFLGSLIKTIFEVIVLGGVGGASGILAATVPFLPLQVAGESSYTGVFPVILGFFGLTFLLLSVVLLAAVVRIATLALRLYRNVADFDSYEPSAAAELGRLQSERARLAEHSP